MEQYQRIKAIGEGAFGQALLVRCRKTNEKFVIKKIDMKKMSKKEKEEARKECSVHKSMSHPNIISFCDSFEQNMTLFIVMDYADGGDLHSKLASRRGRLFLEKQVIDWFVQLCLAIKHVHDRKILHRDLKTQNVFLTSRGMIKLGDFGIAKVLRNTRELAKTQIGTPYYLSPEICNGQAYNNKTDIWSLGVILYEMASLKQPFTGRNLQQLLMSISRAKYAPLPASCSSDLVKLVKKLLCPSATSRPSINKVLEMPFVQRRISSFLGQTLLAEEFSHTVIHSNRGGLHAVANVGSGDCIKSGGRDGEKNRAHEAIPDAHPALLAKADPPPVAPNDASAVVKGVCGVCHLNVTADQERTKDDKGVYYHVQCIKSQPNPRSFLERGKSSGSTDPPSRVTPVEPAPPPPQHYDDEVQQRHVDFIARRQARQSNRNRGGVYGGGAIRRERGGPDSAGPGLDREAQIREFKERQLKAAENRARAEQLERRHEAEQRDDVAVADKSPTGTPTPPVEPSRSGSSEDAAMKAKRIQEFNDRQRRAREYRERAEFDPSVPPPMAPVPEPLPPIATAAPSKSRAVQQEYKSKAGGKSNRRQQNSLAPPSGAAGTPAGIFSIGGSNLAGTYSVHDKGNNGGGAAAGGPGGPGGDATVVIRTEGGAADATKAALEEKAKKRAEARNELRAVIQRKRWEKKKQGNMRLDNLPIMAEAASAPETTSDAHDDAPSPSDDAPSPNDDPLARTIAKLLDHQVEESHTTDAPDDNTSTEENTPTEGAAAHAAVENTSTTEQDASRVPTDGDGDVDADTNIDATNGSGVEEVAQRRQDADYEGMLLHMSMVFRDDKPTVHEGNGGADDNDTFGDDDSSESSENTEDGDNFDEDDSAASHESIFSKMERVRAELEEELGFDLFFDAYRQLRDVFSSPDTETSSDVHKEVPEALAASLRHKLGGDPREASYTALVELVKAENGIF